MKHIISFLTLLICTTFSHAQIGHFYPADNFSSGLISNICQDRQGSVWIATDYGLNRFDGYQFQTFLHDDNDTTSLLNNVVVTMLCDREGRFWVGTNRGLTRFESSSESFISYPFPDNILARVSSLLQLSDGTLIVGTAGYGAYALGKDGQLHEFSLPDESQYFSRMYEDSRGRLWRSGFDDQITMRMGNNVVSYESKAGNPQVFIEQGDELLIICQHGILSYRNGILGAADIDMSAVNQKDIIFTDAAANKDGYIYIGTRGQGIYRISPIHPRRLDPVVINAFGVDPNTAKISSAMFDRRGNLWLGCHHKGLLMVPQQPVQFRNWSFETQGINIGSTISSVCEGTDGNVWCTVQGVGVYAFNRDGRVVSHPHAPDAVEFIFRDRQQRYWIGTDDGLFSYDPTTGHYEQKVEFECDKFNDMTSDSSGNIYISTFSRGFCVFNPQTGEMRNYNMNDTDTINGRLINNWVMGMSVDNAGMLWLATSSGVACFDPQTGSFLTQGWESQLDGIVCFDICELHSGHLADSIQLDGCIAIGTEQGLYLYDRATKKVERFPNSEELSNKVISYIVQANNGDIWCSTSHGIWQYSMEDQAFIGHVYGNGLTKKEYLYGVGMHSDNDQIYFGHNDGLTIFNPGNINERKNSLDSIVLTGFRVGDQWVNTRTIINDVQVTQHALSESNYFTVSYLDHTITLCFSQFNFDNPMNVTFEYQVNGDGWISNQPGKNEFTLGHLQPGTYRIEVRAKIGTDYTATKVIIVTVRAPWYRSLTAYLIYMLLFVGLAIFLFLTYRRRAYRQLNEEKMKFLINATHDIRSPLTLVLAALKKLESSPATETIEHNAKRILNLVNQILDVRKIDKQQMQLHCQKTEIVGFVGGICKMFEFNAKERNIDFVFNHEGIEQLEAWIDPGQFDKVVTNLLSNAFKYSYDDGKISINLSTQPEDSTMKLQVVDNGIGIDADTEKHIFDRFYQGKNSRRMHIDSTGIGLNLCKMIVDMHHGTIEAQNRTDGQRGSVFIVTLPLGNTHLKPEEIETETEEAKATPAISMQTQVQPNSRYRVLIVDDDLEIGKYISNELGRYYKFNFCPNGKDGLKELLTGNDYDVVISDVMMPEMDGFTMLRMIKTNMNISHIPVIMLTSKADVGNRLEGLERGADAFLAKPFDMEELHLTIDNLIQSRQRLRGKFTGAQQQADKVEMPEVKGNDEQLMERIMKAVNKNLSDSDFNVEMLTQEVGISRAQLHRKMKEMTGLTTSEFIRNIRLEQAARLLKEQKINITQVAYTVGFSNLAHFSTIFRKHFGIPPSEYANDTN